MIEVTDRDEACLISSRTRDDGPWSFLGGSDLHMPALDLDFPCELRESSPGRFHLYLNRAITWEKYQLLLLAFYNAGLIEAGFYHSSIARGASYLRVAPRGERETVDWDRPRTTPQSILGLTEFIRDNTVPVESPYRDGIIPVAEFNPQPAWNVEPVVSLPRGPLDGGQPQSVQGQLADIENDLDDIWSVLSRMEENGTSCRCAGCNTESVGQADETARWVAPPQWGSSGESPPRPAESSGSTYDRARDSLQYAVSAWYPDARVVGERAGSGGDSRDEGSEVGGLATDRVDGNR